MQSIQEDQNGEENGGDDRNKMTNEEGTASNEKSQGSMKEQLQNSVDAR